MLRPMTNAELARELSAIAELLPRILPTSPQSCQTRNDWIAYRKAILAEMGRRVAVEYQSQYGSAN